MMKGIKIKVTGFNKVKKLMDNLEPNLNKTVGKKGTIKLAKNLQSRIRRRYTMAGYGKSGSSGMGFKSIIVKPISNGAVVEVGNNAPWVVMFEKGIKSHWVSPYTIRKHLESPGSTFGKSAPKMQYGGTPVWWHWKGPFVEPAMQSFKPMIPTLLNKYVKEAIMDSR